MSKNTYVLMSKDYAMMYHFISDARAWQKVEKTQHKAGLKSRWETLLRAIRPLQRSPLLCERLYYGEGANLQFEPSKKLGHAVHYRLHYSGHILAANLQGVIPIKNLKSVCHKRNPKTLFRPVACFC